MNGERLSLGSSPSATCCAPSRPAESRGRRSGAWMTHDPDTVQAGRAARARRGDHAPRRVPTPPGARGRQNPHRNHLDPRPDATRDRRRGAERWLEAARMLLNGSWANAGSDATFRVAPQPRPLAPAGRNNGGDSSDSAAAAPVGRIPSEAVQIDDPARAPNARLAGEVGPDPFDRRRSASRRRDR